MSDNQRLILGSLAMDLKRVALGLYRGSLTTANVFQKEAIKRISELEDETNDSRIKRLIGETKKNLTPLKKDRAEDLLMYSTLFQNQAKKL